MEGTMTHPQTDQRAAKIAGLRELADWLEQNPDVEFYSTNIGFHLFSEDEAREKLPIYARAMGTAEKDAHGAVFALVKTFSGGVRYTVQTDRENVCERVVVDRERVEVEEPDPDQVALLPKVKRTEVREKVEWRCPPSILGTNR